MWEVVAEEIYKIFMIYKIYLANPENLVNLLCN